MQSEQRTDKLKNNESNTWNLWDNIKGANLCISRDCRRKGGQNVFKEIMTENFPNLKEGKKMPSYRKNIGSKTRWAWRDPH